MKTPFAFALFIACSGVCNGCSSNVAPPGADASVMARPDLRTVLPADPDLTMASMDDLTLPEPDPGDMAGASTCPDSSKLVYLIDSNGTFSSFKPDKLLITDIGKLNCPSMFGQPNSMAVDRQSIARVGYSSGEMFNVDVKTLKCTKTKWVPNQMNYTTFGMGYASNTPGGNDETLFIADTGTRNLGSVDTTLFTVHTINMLMGSPELTGTGDAKLWAFFPDANMPRVARLDKKTGAEIGSWPMPDLAGSPLAWAFAFWGGDFWVFLKRGGDPATIVWQLTGAGKVSMALDTMNRLIVGAGVSTCAPVVITH